MAQRLPGRVLQAARLGLVLFCSHDIGAGTLPRLTGLGRLGGVDRAWIWFPDTAAAMTLETDVEQSGYRLIRVNHSQGEAVFASPAGELILRLEDRSAVTHPGQGQARTETTRSTILETTPAPPSSAKGVHPAGLERHLPKVNPIAAKNVARALGFKAVTPDTSVETTVSAHTLAERARQPSAQESSTSWQWTSQNPGLESLRGWLPYLGEDLPPGPHSKP